MLNIILITIFGTIALVIFITAILSTIPRKIGFRNVFRRFGNTVLVVIGSLVGSALISGSLVLSDSLDKTFYDMVERLIGEQDVDITLNEKSIPDTIVPVINEEEYKSVEEMLEIDGVDGVLPKLSFQISPQKIDESGDPVLNDYGVLLESMSLEEARNFGSEPNDFDDLDDNEAIVSVPLSERLELSEGDTVRINYGQVTFDLKVAYIYEENGIIGSKYILANNEYIASQLGLPLNSYNTISVSADGGVEPVDYDGDDFKSNIETAIEGFESQNYDLVVKEWKQEALEGYGIKTFSYMFIALSFFGVFSGILLIVNLYSMLAEERKMEMGILRAIALTRTQLTQTFIYEGFVYSIISSFIGAILGLGIGFALVKGLEGMFEQVMDVAGSGGVFNISFGFRMRSLLIAFAFGFIITIITTIFSSQRISRLNIVSAIRGIKEKKEKKINLSWIAKTIVHLILTIASFCLLGTFFTIRNSMQSARDQGGEQNPLATMDQIDFEETVDLVQSYMLYIGFVLASLLFASLVNKFIKHFLKKDWSRGIFTIVSVLNIIFTILMINLESFLSALEQEAGIFMFFLIGLVLVFSSSLIITFNLVDISRFIIWPLRQINSLRSIVRIAFRYPAENRSRTGLTLVMFALVIFLIAFISMMKATMRKEMRDNLSNALGGYNLVIQPGSGVTQKQIDEIKDKLLDTNSVDAVDHLTQASIIMPEYKYKDLPDAQFWGNPNAVPFYSEDDFYKTFYNGMPDDFLINTNKELEERAEGYDSDSEVWQTVVDDSTKIVLGQMFVAEGSGKKPSLRVGDKVEIADNFNEGVKEKEIIGIVSTEGGGGGAMGLYSYVVTSNKHLENEFSSEYIDKFSSRNIVVKFVDGVNKTEEVITIKKKIMDYNIRFILELDDLTGTIIAFVDSMLTMFQGFLAFSLIVGTSGLAIIIARAVHERRQQIGMLRSLGFQRWMILVSFYIESTFITLLGILIGIAMGTVGSLIMFEVAFKDQPDAVPIFPVSEIVIICVLVYTASIVFALLPSLKASRLSPVEATNYPE